MQKSAAPTEITADTVAAIQEHSDSHLDPYAITRSPDRDGEFHVICRHCPKEDGRYVIIADAFRGLGVSATHRFVNAVASHERARHA